SSTWVRPCSRGLPLRSGRSRRSVTADRPSGRVRQVSADCDDDVRGARGWRWTCHLLGARVDRLDRRRRQLQRRSHRLSVALLAAVFVACDELPPVEVTIRSPTTIPTTSRAPVAISSRRRGREGGGAVAKRPVAGGAGRLGGGIVAARRGGSVGGDCEAPLA